MSSFKHILGEYKWFILGIVLFISINMYATYNEFYFLNFIPLAIILGLVAIYRIDNFFLITVFCVPLSVPLYEITSGLSFNLNLPSELFLLALSAIFFLKLIHDKRFDIRIAKHPVSLAIYFNLFWLIFTSFTSTMPDVSFKFVASRIWFVSVFYFLATELFKRPKFKNKFLWAYIFSFSIVILYTILSHMGHGFANKDAAHFVMQPFYKDHTSYGAILAMYIPVIVLYLLKQSRNISHKTFIYLLAAFYLLAIILSYTRAAWLSLVFAGGVFAVLLLKIKFRFILLSVVVLVLFYLSIRIELQHRWEKNNQDSSDNLMEHVESITNISTDASNLERINRWKCAIRMFKEKPFLGWGPGTYTFQYAPFQISNERTIISTNAANRGNAHSEYIGPLAESGVLGSLSFTLIVILVIITGIRVYKRSVSLLDKRLSLSLLLGLITYYVHAFLNNFLDMDKANVPFWGFTAILVLMDVQQQTKVKEKDLEKLKTKN
jgi:putative inorganic carbon (HCO3(-)) transporter